MKQLKKGLAIFSVILFLIANVVAYTNTKTTRTLIQAVKAMEQQVRNEEDALAGFDVSVDTKEVEVAMYNASETGNKICDIQNQITASRNPEEILLQTDALKVYFDDNILRTRWFASNEAYVTWKFETSYDAAMQHIPVLWTLRANGSGEILAVVRGQYGVSTKTFSNMELHTTRLSAAFVQTDGRGYESDVE